MEKQPYHDFFFENLNDYHGLEKKRLILSLLITSITMIIELIGGLLANSIALISDAGHMFTHCFAIGLGLVAIFVARKPPCHHRTFGLYRAEILAAFTNGLFLLGVSALILYEAILRIINPVDIVSYQMLLIGIIGLIVNLISIFILKDSSKEDLNIQGVFYHMIADTASSIGVVGAAVVISFTNWTIIDPLISIGISFVILYWALNVLKDSTRILLEMAPKGLDTDIIKSDVKKKFPEIKDLFNIHLWVVSSNMYIFSAYIRLDDDYDSLLDQERLISRINDYLFKKYNIIDSTIQVSSKYSASSCKKTLVQNN